MSKTGVQRLIEFASSNEDFLKMLTEKPEEAVRGFNLTKDEKKALLIKPVDLPKVIKKLNLKPLDKNIIRNTVRNY